MIKKINMGNRTLKFVVRHQWDGQIDYDKFDKWNEKKLGIWWKTYRTHKYQTKINYKSTWDSLMIGLNLIWMNVWVDYGKKVTNRKYTKKYNNKRRE